MIYKFDKEKAVNYNFYMMKYIIRLYQGKLRDYIRSICGGSNYMEKHKQISQGEKFIEIYNKLRNGEKVECEVCQKGYLVTPYDYKTSHYFECSHCKAMLNID